jgi:ABC-type sugar transport system substrate-binding protein
MRRTLLGVSAAVALAAAVAGCGNADDDTSTATATATATATPTATATTAAAPASGEREKRATDAAKAAVTNEGGPVEVPSGKTVAILDLLGDQESSIRMHKAAERAAKAFGWKLLSFDSGGNPDKAAANAQSAVNQGADAIISVAITPVLETQGLKAAAAKGIPVINIAGAVMPTPDINASYVSEDTAGTLLMADHMKQQMPSGSTLGFFETPLIYGLAVADKAFKEQAATNGWDIVQDTKIELADIAGTVERGMNALLGTHPNVTAAYVDISGGLPVAAQVLKAHDKCGKVQLYGYQDDQINQNAIRQGCAQALSSFPLEATPLMAMDQLAEYFARDKKPADIPADDASLAKLYTIDLLTPQVITKDNLPSEGQYPPAVEDYQTFFATKWSDEFKVSLSAP